MVIGLTIVGPIDKTGLAYMSLHRNIAIGKRPLGDSVAFWGNPADGADISS